MRIQRRMLSLALVAALIFPGLAACAPAAPAPTPTTAPAAKPTEAPKPAPTPAPAASPTPAPAKPTEPAKPAATPAATAQAQPGVTGKYTTFSKPEKMGGFLTEGSFADIRTLNPVLVSDTASGAITALVFSGLTFVHPETLQPEPDLAARWEVAPDNKTYTFYLRKGVKFHDGTELTANDVKFTYDLLMNKDVGSPRTSELVERIDKIEVKDPYTIVFTLKKVVAPFMVTNTSYGIVPMHILKDVAPQDVKSHPLSTGDPKATIGTGPFKFKEWVKGDHITLEKFKDYFRGEPALDQYVYKVVKDANAVAAALKTGEIDFGGFPESFYEEMSRQQNLTVHRYDTFNFTFYAYQLDPEKSTLFQDKRVRQALAYALDREGMIKAIRFGIGQVAVGTMPVLSWAYAPDQIQNKYPYDVNKAKALLDEAGWKPGPDGIREKDGKKLSFRLWTNAGNVVREQYITYMQQAWKQIGVDATPATEEWAAYLNRITETKDFEIFLVGFAWGVDPDQSTMWKTDAYKGGFNMNKYSNPEVDRLLEEALTTLDVAKRKELYIRMQNILADELPSFIIDFPQALAATSKRTQNLIPNAVNFRPYAHLWWVR